jgi:arsenite transporter
MMYPILCKVRYETLHHIFRQKSVWTQLLFSVIMNWLVAPFLMVRQHFDSISSSPPLFLLLIFQSLIWTKI